MRIITWDTRDVVAVRGGKICMESRQVEGFCK